MNIKILFLTLIAAYITTDVFGQKEEALRAYALQNYRTAANQFDRVVQAEPSAQHYQYLGNALSYIGKYDSARIAYEAGIKADSKYGPNYAGVARTYFSQNNTAKAVEFLSQAKSTTNPNKDVSYYLWAAEAYLNNANPNPKEAINLLEKAKEVNYKNAMIYYLLGDAYYKLRDGGKAVTNYDLALQYDPKMIIAHSKIGDVWTESRSSRIYDDALKAYNKALAVDPNFAPALKGLANLYYLTSQFDKAKETFDKYLAVGELTEETRYRQLDLSYRAKDYANVKRQAEELLQREPERIRLKRLIAYINYELGNYDEGMAMLNQFMANHDSIVNAEDYIYLARFQRHKKNDSLAIINFSKALEMDTLRVDLYDTLSTLAYSQKNYDKAASYLHSKIKRVETPTIQDYFALGRAHYFAKNYIQSDSAFAKVTEMSPTWPIGYIWRARATLGFDNPENPAGLATPHYLKVIETAGSDSVKYKREMAEALKYFGNLATLKENYTEAMVYYNRALALNPDDADIRKTMEAIREVRKKK